MRQEGGGCAPVLVCTERAGAQVRTSWVGWALEGWLGVADLDAESQSSLWCESQSPGRRWGDRLKYNRAPPTPPPHLPRTPRDALGIQESNSGRLGLREQVRNLGSRNWGTRWGWGVRNEAKAQLSELGHFPCGTRVLYILPAEILETGVCLPLGPGRACQVRGAQVGLGEALA